MDIGLDVKQRAAVYHVIKPLEIAMALTNDYFSYPKEKALHPLHNVSGNIFNAVPILMAEHAISEDDALALLKQKIIEAEEEHRAKFQELEHEGPIPHELKWYIMACRMATSGFHLWHASAPRYAIMRLNEKGQYSGRTIVSEKGQSSGRSIVSRIWNWMHSAP